MTEATPKRRRARKADGQFKADNPDTVTNEAWEPVEVPIAKENKYEVKTKVSGKSGDAGKYQKTSKVRPTFGKAYTVSN